MRVSPLSSPKLPKRCPVKSLAAVGVCVVLLQFAPSKAEPQQKAEGANGLKPRDVVYISAGEFVMGTSEEEARRLAADYGVHPSLFLTESPRRKIQLKAFFIDRYPVTNAQYKEFVDATDYKRRRSDYPEGKGDYPVTLVRWTDAVAYASWAGARLPTQEEWEKAARGTDGRTYPWGDEWRDDATRTDDLTSLQTRANTTPVGAFPAGASPYGVMDLCGNVSEWTSTRMPPDTIDNYGFFVIKGASAVLSQRYNFRCAARNFSAHEGRTQTYLGFRCVRDVPERPLPAAVAPAVGPPTDGPRRDLYRTEPIRVGFTGGHNAEIHVPYFPQAKFVLNVPEVAGSAETGATRGGPTHRKNNPDGSCQYTFVWPENAEFRVKLVPHLDCVDFTITIQNLTDKPLTRVYTNSCFSPHLAPYFFDPERVRTFGWTDAGVTSLLQLPFSRISSPGETFYCGWPLTTGTGNDVHLEAYYDYAGWPLPTGTEEVTKGSSRLRPPCLFVRSRDGRWVIAQAYDEVARLENNAHYTCLHALPVWPEIPAGEERSKTGKLYFLRGGPAELLARWKADFGK